MLVDDAAVLHRHVPAGELDHLGAEAPMDVVERGFFELGSLSCGWGAHTKV
jgi:hypothetical protein